MSPEQIAGDDADQQSDVWSLGAVLYEMLAGQAAFKGEHQWTVMNAIANRTPTPLHSMRAQIPSAVEQIVMKALQKPRERRYGSADECLEAEGYDPRTVRVLSASRGQLRLERHHGSLGRQLRDLGREALGASSDVVVRQDVVAPEHVAGNVPSR